MTRRKIMLQHLLRALAALLGAWLVGFVWFIFTVPDEYASARSEGVDGVVVFTGSAGRVRAGIAALQAEIADRLLVSGVDPELDSGILRPAITDDAELFDCCIDLGRAALNTEGNAAEAVAWAKAHDMQRLAVVTADWHMRRSLVEFARQDHALTIYSMPVASEASVWRLIVEYCKYLAALVRAGVA